MRPVPASAAAMRAPQLGTVRVCVRGLPLEQPRVQCVALPLKDATVAIGSPNELQDSRDVGDAKRLGELKCLRGSYSMDSSEELVAQLGRRASANRAHVADQRPHGIQ